MTEPKDHVVVNVAWPYANGPRHIGHVAGFGVPPSDVFARYQRMRGANVLMVSGTDEHGTPPLLVQADKEGVHVRDLADRYNRQIVEDLAGLGLSYDLFTRTATRNHYSVVQELFKGLYNNGYMLKETTQGAISPSTGRTLPDRYIEVRAPPSVALRTPAATSAITAATSSIPSTLSTRSPRSTARRHSSLRPSTSCSTCPPSRTRSRHG